MNRTFYFSFTLLLLFFVAILLSSCGSNSTSETTIPSQNYLYTSTNDPQGNEVVIMKIAEDGGLTQSAVVSTGDVGDADDTASIDGGGGTRSGLGDLIDSQGSMWVIGNYLLVPNAGEVNFAGRSGADRFNGSISVFRISDGGASLTLVPSSAATVNVDSMGIRPQTMDYYNDGNTIWVLVGNGVSDPFCEAGDASVNNPVVSCTSQHGRTLGDGDTDLLNTATTATDINGVLINTDKRNVALFSFADGVLTPRGIVAIFNDAANGPVTQVSFSQSGSLRVAISTLGVPHLAPGGVNATLQYPGRVYLFDATNTSGTLALSNGRFFKRNEISANIGFSWDSNGKYIYGTNGIVTNSGHQDVITLDTDDTTNVFTLSVGTDTAPSAVTGVNITTAADATPTSFIATSGPAPSVVCWSWLSPNNDSLLIAALVDNSITSIAVDGEALTIRNKETRITSAGTFIAAPDTKDIFVVNNQKYAYVLGAFNTHSISILDVTSAGLVRRNGASPYDIPASRIGTNDANVPSSRHAYLGLTAYPAYYVGY